MYFTKSSRTLLDSVSVIAAIHVVHDTLKGLLTLVDIAAVIGIGEHNIFIT